MTDILTETPVWLEGKAINEVAFCKAFLQNRPLRCVNGRFYGTDGAVDDATISYEISMMLTAHVSYGIAKKVQALTAALKLLIHSEPFKTRPDEIHLLNGTLRTDGTFTPEKKICVNRLNVEYRPELRTGAYYPERFLTFLTELLEPEDINTLQEYMGYCMIPSTKGQSMLFIIGNGEEGKSRITKLMSHIWGNSMVAGKFQRIEHDRFFRYNLVDKLVMFDDDMEMDALKNTGILKSLVTCETPMDVEAKGKQSEQVKLYARIMGLGNGTPKSLYDKSDGYARRLLILTTKPKPPNRINDPDIADKFITEKEKIFLWMFDGLQRLIANGFRFTKSAKTVANIKEAVADNCNIIEFINDGSYITLDENAASSTTNLYSAYLDWCSKNLATALKKDAFSNWLKSNAEQYHLSFSTHVRNEQGREVRGYRGLCCHYAYCFDCE